MSNQEYEDALERCAAEILEYLDIDGYECEVMEIIEKHFPQSSEEIEAML